MATRARSHSACGHLARAHRVLSTATKHLARAQHEGSAVGRTGIACAYDTLDGLEREQDGLNCPTPKKKKEQRRK